MLRSSPEAKQQQAVHEQVIIMAVFVGDIRSLIVFHPVSTRVHGFSLIACKARVQDYVTCESIKVIVEALYLRENTTIVHDTTTTSRF